MSRHTSLVALVAGLLGSLATVAPATVVIMDPVTNNGSFEVDQKADGTTGPITGWNHPGGSANFKVRKPGYLVGATDGTQSLNVVTLAGWYSDVLTTPVPAGETVTMSVDLGWDSWPNMSPAAGATAYLYAVNPADYNDQAFLLQASGTPTYAGFGTTAGWVTISNSALMQGVHDGWYLQVVVASGGNANNMIDNFVITHTGEVPEPASLSIPVLGGIALLRRKRR